MELSLRGSERFQAPLPWCSCICGKNESSVRSPAQNLCHQLAFPWNALQIPKALSRTQEETKGSFGTRNVSTLMEHSEIVSNSLKSTLPAGRLESDQSFSQGTVPSGRGDGWEGRSPHSKT